MNFSNQRVAPIVSIAPKTYVVEQTWKDLANASPKKRPPLSAVFDPSKINPYTCKPVLDDVKRAIKIAKEIRDPPWMGSSTIAGLPTTTQVEAMTVPRTPSQSTFLHCWFVAPVRHLVLRTGKASPFHFLKHAPANLEPSHWNFTRSG